VTEMLSEKKKKPEVWFQRTQTHARSRILRWEQDEKGNRLERVRGKTSGYGSLSGTDVQGRTDPLVGKAGERAWTRKEEALSEYPPTGFNNAAGAQRI